MQLSITARNFELTPAIKEHVNSSLQPLKHHFQHLSTPIHVVLSIEKYQHIAAAHVHLPRTKDIEASSSSKDMYASISELAKSLDQQAIKHKEEMKQRGDTPHG